MTIHHFAVEQNDVFVPALLAALVATIAIALPVVLAPTLRRGRRGRPTVVLAAAVAAVALVVAGWQAGVGVRTLQQERVRVAVELRDRYGLDLRPAQVAALVDGAAVRLGGRPVELRRTEDDRFEVVTGRRVLAPQA